MINSYTGENILSIENLTIEFKEDEEQFNAIKNFTMHINKGEMVALIGESGCGKTVTSLSVMGLLPQTAVITKGNIYFFDNNMNNLTQNQWNEYRGKELAMIFQEPMTALNPLVKVGKQIAENAILHGHNKLDAKNLTYDIMEKVGLPDVKKIYNVYPHQLSGGMRQRIVIAMALINNPALLIADEPTTALDVTIQAQILELIKSLNKDRHTAVMLISHDLGVVGNLCERLYIMYSGVIVESGLTEQILKKPLHPYTQGLINSIPNISKKGTRLKAINGFVPSLEERKNEGCPFANRCDKCMDICKKQMPNKLIVNTTTVYCHLYTNHKGGEYYE